LDLDIRRSITTALTLADLALPQSSTPCTPDQPAGVARQNWISPRTLSILTRRRRIGFKFRQNWIPSPWVWRGEEEELIRLPWRGQCGRAAAGCARIAAALR
jgi:hypothetical protein